MSTTPPSSGLADYSSEQDDRWPYADPILATQIARESDQPVLLSWSAKWCPPCAEMQLSVLQRPAFRARWSRLVPLSIDGDAPGAQAYGERVDADVYPTYLLLDAEERVWLRIPCGLKEERFCEILDTALRVRRPIAHLALALRADASGLTEDELTLLAYHYWPLEKRVQPGTDRLGFMERLEWALTATGSVAASRLLTWHLIERAGRPDAETSAHTRQRLADRFSELLDSSQATFSTLYYVLVGLEPVLRLLCMDDDARRRRFSEGLSRILTRFVEDDSLTWTERLIAQSTLLSLHTTAEDIGIDEQWKKRTRRLVASADAGTESATGRQSVMNMAGHVLNQCGLKEESIKLFRAEIDRSPWPTYFMPYVAETLMELGDPAEAFRWWRRAHEETGGKTTRFELGVRYAVALVRNAPTERSQIDRLVARLFAEYGDNPDLSRGRVRKSIGLLSQTLAGWTT